MDILTRCISNYRVLLILAIIWVPSDLWANSPGILPVDATHNSFSTIAKGGIAYQHGAIQPTLLYNMRLVVAFDMLFGVASNVHVGVITGVHAGLTQSSFPISLAARDAPIIEIPLYATIAYPFTPNIIVQPSTGFLFNLSGTEPLYYYVFSAQATINPIALEAAYLLNINALTSNTEPLLAHSFRVAILVVVPLLKVAIH